MAQKHATIQAGLATALAGMAALALILTTAPRAEAHEYWVEPQGAPVLAVGAALKAEFKVGVDFKGSRNPLIPNNIRSLVIASPDGSRAPLGGDLGQRPAVQATAEQAGTYVVGLVTTRSKLVWREAERFASFIDYEGLDGIAEQHAARGLPDIGFAETYARSAKALFQVEAGALKDQAMGMPLELVMTQHDAQAGRVRLQVLEAGQPLADNQVRLFHRLAGQVSDVVVRSDGQGFVSFDVSAGGQFMANTVTLRPVTEPKWDEVWHSWWGSLSFSLPE